jgi:hypothetical protein
MGSLIGIISTVILVSTIGTLIFAVGAYIIARGNREGVNEMVTDSELPGTDNIEDQFPHQGEVSSSHSEPADGGLFTRLPPTAGGDVDGSKTDDEYLWK